MLIIYDVATGVVLDNTGTNSAAPTGPDGTLVYVNTDNQGISRDTLALLRLHDEHDAELVEKILRSFHRIDVATGAVILEGPYPSLTSEPPTIPADGTTTSVITYRSGRAPDEVTFDVNGAAAKQAVVDDVAAIEVTAAAPGPVVVRCEGLELTITAEEVQP